ncbi:MAG: 50S ribosomal protein L9 [Candidatus Cloacimonadota bacterium]|nr:50S ribosomal protein L9 [Candidatus Cloacimonadota bacterium]
MKVILKKQSEKLGEVGDIVKVADGYARNYLFPKDIAIPATPKNLKLINQLKEAEEKRRAEELKEAEIIMKQIEKTTCTFERLADENGHLYGSVSELDIAKALEEKGLTIDKNDVKMEKHIKDIGNHIVEIELQEDIKGQLKIKVKKQKKENTDEENS